MIFIFTNEHCVPCKRMKPIFDKIEVDKMYIDTDTETGVELSQKYFIRSTPALVKVDKDGTALDVMFGIHTEDEVMEFVR